jgi:Mg2+ and Co2+ transporter CorA
LQLEGLLSLKQQQASLVEADASLKLSYQSIAQGRSIMLFTVVTIIFLPLSFMSSVFGMNASELSGSDGGKMSLRHQFSFMCTPF